MCGLGANKEFIMSKLFVFPVTIFVLFQFAFVVDIFTDHDVPDSGYFGIATESYIFGQLINIACILMGFVVYIRFRGVTQLIYHYTDLPESVTMKNIIGMWLGIGSCLGLNIVANFPSGPSLSIHYVAASNCFGFMVAYFWLQTYLTYKVRPYASSLRMAHGRCCLTIFNTIIFAIFVLILSPTFILSKWILITIFCFYILTFTNDFKSISFDICTTVSMTGFQQSETRSGDTKIKSTEIVIN